MTATNPFQPAVRHKAKLKLALLGPTNGGKTYTALAVATALGRRVAVFDTEAGKSVLYKPPFVFDIDKAKRTEPEDYIQAIRSAVEHGYDVLILDSMTHAWFSLLDGVDQTTKQKAANGGKADSWGSWKEHTPRQRAMIDEIVQSPIHIIATVRTEMETVRDVDDKGKLIGIRRVGLQPKQRAGFEYEFDLIIDMERGGIGTVTKSRCEALTNRQIRHPGAALAAELLAWLNTGEEAPRPAGWIPPTTTEEGWAIVHATMGALDDASTLEELATEWKAWATKINNGAGQHVAKAQRDGIAQYAKRAGSTLLDGKPWEPTDDEAALVEVLRSSRARAVLEQPAPAENTDEDAEAPAAE